LEQSARLRRVVAQSLWTVDRLGNVGDDPVAPAANLVAKEPEASRGSAADGAFGDDAPLGPVAVADRRHLDHESAVRHSDHKRGVVDVALRTALAPRGQRLVDP